jgi:hypothetical protein
MLLICHIWHPTTGTSITELTPSIGPIVNWNKRIAISKNLSNFAVPN